MNTPAKIPAIRNYLEKHVFELVYRHNGKLIRPKTLGAIAFPNGSVWQLYSVAGVEYVTQSYQAKVFRKLETVLADVAASGGVKLLTNRQNLPLHAWFFKPCIAKTELENAVADGSLSMATLV